MTVYFYGTFFFLMGLMFLIMGIFFLQYNSLVLEIFIPMYFLSDVSFSFCLDYVSMLFFSTVSFISSMVFIYSNYYMSMEDKEKSDDSRFLIILFLFVISMFFLVFSFSWITVMLGWDGLGLISFLLVIYYNDTKSLESGLVTVLTNRIGDCFFLLSFSFMFYCGWMSFDYLTMFSSVLFIIIVMLGSITKSAQMPFSSWLPAAMAAPTPVSSLVHSSTLVTAGVFLLIRFNYLLEDSFFLLSVISLMTMALAGLFAVYELDFKKIVAMSTLSQLGFMIFSISLGNWLMSFLHVIFHAFFKSCLFLSTGNLMHFIFGNQDSRLFSGFYMSFFSKLFFSMSCLSLMGFPFSLGFYSKDMILGYSMFYMGGLIVFVFCISCCFTVAYSLRLLDLGFLKFSSFDCISIFGEEKNFFIPVSFLFFFNVFIGNFFMFYFFPLENFSLIDFCLGIPVILGGFVFYKSKIFFYKFNFFMSSMAFLPYLISGISSKVQNSIFSGDDLTWNELMSAKGIKYFLEKFNNVIFYLYFTNTFYLGVFFLVMLFFSFMYVFV